MPKKRTDPTYDIPKSNKSPNVGPNVYAAMRAAAEYGYDGPIRFTSGSRTGEGQMKAMYDNWKGSKHKNPSKEMIAKYNGSWKAKKLAKLFEKGELDKASEFLTKKPISHHQGGNAFDTAGEFQKWLGTDDAKPYIKDYNLKILDETGAAQKHFHVTTGKAKPKTRKTDGYLNSMRNYEVAKGDAEYLNLRDYTTPAAPEATVFQGGMKPEAAVTSQGPTYPPFQAAAGEQPITVPEVGPVIPAPGLKYGGMANKRKLSKQEILRNIASGKLVVGGQTGITPIPGMNQDATGGQPMGGATPLDLGDPSSFAQSVTSSDGPEAPVGGDGYTPGAEGGKSGFSAGQAANLANAAVQIGTDVARIAQSDENVATKVNQGVKSGINTGISQIPVVGGIIGAAKGVSNLVQGFTNTEEQMVNGVKMNVSKDKVSAGINAAIVPGYEQAIDTFSQAANMKGPEQVGKIFEGIGDAIGFTTIPKMIRGFTGGDPNYTPQVEPAPETAFASEGDGSFDGPVRPQVTDQQLYAKYGGHIQQYEMGGQLTHYNGLPHAEVPGEPGGIQVGPNEVAGGETEHKGFVFTDELMDPKSGAKPKQQKSYADVTKKLESMYKDKNDPRVTKDLDLALEQKKGEQEAYKRMIGMPSELDQQLDAQHQEAMAKYGGQLKYGGRKLFGGGYNTPFANAYSEWMEDQNTPVNYSGGKPQRKRDILPANDPWSTDFESTTMNPLYNNRSENETDVYPIQPMIPRSPNLQSNVGPEILPQQRPVQSANDLHLYEQSPYFMGPPRAPEEEEILPPKNSKLNNPTKGNIGTNWGELGMLGANALASNIGNFVGLNKLKDGYDTVSNVPVTPQRQSYHQLLEGIKSGVDTARYNNRMSGRNSVAAERSLLSAGLKARGAAEERLENEFMNTKLAADQFNSQQEMQAKDLTARNKGAYDSREQQIYDSFGSNLSGAIGDYGQYRQNQEERHLLNQYFDDYDFVQGKGGKYSFKRKGKTTK